MLFQNTHLFICNLPWCLVSVQLNCRLDISTSFHGVDLHVIQSGAMQFADSSNQTRLKAFSVVRL